ncbi:hypothetical protein IWW34DRAFT_803494 [Fusarium oxysporum f. sp. albedinis]|nr:hypothetical protein IWW34DRAFT_803494 [Fusarium oxysporum f. sp. albedinis]
MSKATDKDEIKAHAAAPRAPAGIGWFISFHCQVKQKSICIRDLEAIPKLQGEWMSRIYCNSFVYAETRQNTSNRQRLVNCGDWGCGLGRLQSHKLWLQKRVLGGEMDVEEEDKWSGVVRVEVEVSIKLHVMNAMFDIGRPQYVQETNDMSLQDTNRG